MISNLLRGLSVALVLLNSLSSLALAKERTEQIHVVEHAAGDTTNRVGPNDDNTGDILTFLNDIYDSGDTAKIGSDLGFCIRVAVGKAYHCVWSTSLAAGQITVQGSFLDSSDSVLSVTGGTGDYADVRGEMLLHARDAKGTEYDFSYTLHHSDP